MNEDADETVDKLIRERVKFGEKKTPIGGAMNLKDQLNYAKGWAISYWGDCEGHIEKEEFIDLLEAFVLDMENFSKERKRIEQNEP